MVILFKKYKLQPMLHLHPPRAHALPTSTNKLKEPYQSPLPHQSPDDTLPPYQSLNHSKKRPY